MKEQSISAVKQWVLRTPAGLYAYLDGIKIALTPDRNKATVFDERDNEEIKARFYSVILKTAVEPEIIACAS